MRSHTPIGVVLLAAAGALVLASCLQPPPHPGTDGDSDVDVDADADSDAEPEDCPSVVYRDDLAGHPGCSTAGLEFPAASIPGYRCAAKAYLGPTEDPGLPVVVLIHGNSDGVGVWEPHVDPSCDPVGPDQGAPMLSDRLMEAGYRSYAIDMRADQTCAVDRCDCSDYSICNPVRTMDHGWGVPIAMHLLESVMAAHPDRQIAIVAHSYGVTVARDALRRLFFRGVPVFERVEHVVLLSGANHGVSSYCGYDCCGQCNTMRGNCACEMGFRDAFSPTCFTRALNGPDGAWETPCGDGQSAFGRQDACGGHAVRYTTIVMEDEADGSQRDLCTSESSAELMGAQNYTISLESPDRSDYFYCQLLQNHFGSPRSAEALALITDVLAR